MDSLFVRDGTRYVPTDFARGPWAPEFLDGGAVAGIVGHVAEASRPGELRLARFTLDLLAPVPVAPLTVEAQVVHAGRRFEIRDVMVRTEDGALVSRASVLNIAHGDTPPFAMPQSESSTPPPAEVVPEFRIPTAQTCFQNAVEARMYEPPTEERAMAGWARLRMDVVEGEPRTPTVAALALSDRGNAMTSLSPDMSRAAINADITALFAREPVGDWLGLDGGLRYRGAGRGAGSMLMRDADGVVGLLAVSLLPPRFDFGLSGELSAALQAHDGGSAS
ncbi:MAG: thioesterase family protein [Dehalococcoidia bacterium]